MSPKNSSQKPSLTRSGLQNHGIHFDERVHRFEDLEDWMQPICYQLTRSRKQPPKEAKEGFKEESERFRTSGQDCDEASRDEWSLEPTEEGSDSAAQESEIEDCQQAAKKVRRWRERNENESKWTHFFREKIFKDFSDLPGGTDSHK